MDLQTSYETVKVEREGGIAWITLNRPEKLNALSSPMLRQFEEHLDRAEKSPEVRVVVLSMNASEEYVLQALRAGAAGYLLKNISPVELEQAIRAVARGESFLSPAISRHVIAAYLQRTGGGLSSLERLSPRQREILQLVAEGNTSKDIARKLNLSVKTVETHRTQLMESLDIHDIAGLVRFAIRMGVITPDA